jgi:hypothetical protein
VRHHKYGTLLQWTVQLLPGVTLCAIVLASRPRSEWPALVSLVVLYFAVVIAFAAWVARDRRVQPALRAPGSAAFVTQNVPAAIVHVERFVVPGAGFARGPSFVIVADDAGVSYYTRGKNPVAFVRIPWLEISGVSASGGDLLITLADGSLLIHIPGGVLPMGRRRVRALAAEMAKLLENEGSVRADIDAN